MTLETLVAAAVPAVRPHASTVPLTLHTPLPQMVQSFTWWQAHAPWLTHGIAGIFLLCALALIVLLAVQTTKQEGLSGTIGGRVESAYRGRLGADEQLKRLTGWIAIGFAATGFILTITGI
ncbi:MAG: preprotein translocase subunit SecG [Candidatus Tyrphobacter sp.]